MKPRWNPQLRCPRVLKRWVSDVRLPTIYALSTKQGRSAIAVIRISGPSTLDVFKRLSRIDDDKRLQRHRLASVRKLYDPKSGVLLDEALSLFFKGPNSYTGEDVLELHVHGGNAVVKCVLNAIKYLHESAAPIRYADPGEFSRRGFQNGKFDLTEVEGVRDMIDAETEFQRVSALTSLKGETRHLFHRWRTEIVKNVALLTTVIDFGEDHDIEEVNELFGRVAKNIDLLEAEIKNYLEKVKRSEILMKGIKLSLIGPPNAGKSSLLNVLSDSDSVIVSDIPGTTRDSIDIPLDVGGYKVVIGDTAGIRSFEDADIIEKEGIKRATTKSLNSDVAVIILPVDLREINSDLIKHIENLKSSTSSCSENILVALNKSDLLEDPNQHSQIIKQFSEALKLPESTFCLISCANRDGIDSLMGTLIERFKIITLTTNSDPISISQRSQDILSNDVLHGFQEFRSYNGIDDVLATESLRYSVEGIGKITGEAVGIEEILGVVFSSFCIGK
ncbi:tRNA modification GTPase MSS1, mitochondrial [Komagataella phaffii CBS 7435]|uniref:Mitochondrial protein, forms a heterodimer complex with Mto1p n=2 Tax=Komagataella phaffii TaxID=460519 RepID=C4QYU5_KOMPG|nr:Mitochondrial protein, forms a heterodimer complex with Mto1p [Komagataella phaffii GS115]AOA61454.1 GQ67_01582T0 [Komagataella phaffii]CAH2447245.1 tRNA modification GTPase MSS1, mitochondrial [Komagataella phaffii CBS 7435]AOA66351.1 GQ68_01598T0 [Komagataella phaffii GS115]CAY68419.1 Mitochondrial protein, forms a heterodimer complex with Mto1p [Komagataella phaffii GS115]CCA37484.1 tRNA modification GTPase MSS1, mitochondrial [Komagataella phaffii CBS 7435]